jgi:hypothetical protein
MPYHNNLEKFYPGRGSGKVSGGNMTEHKCAICSTKWMVNKFYNGIVTEMTRCGGPHWEPLYCCPSHTDFEIEVWKVKTKRRIA